LGRDLIFLPAGVGANVRKISQKQQKKQPQTNNKGRGGEDFLQEPVEKGKKKRGGKKDQAATSPEDQFLSGKDISTRGNRGTARTYNYGEGSDQETRARDLQFSGINGGKRKEKPVGIPGGELVR